MAGVSAGNVWRLAAEGAEGRKGPSAMPPGIRDVFQENRNLFAEWRYLHERRGAWAGTGMLKAALSAIIDTFEEPTPPPEFSRPDARGS